MKESRLNLKNLKLKKVKLKAYMKEIRYFGNKNSYSYKIKKNKLKKIMKKPSENLIKH